MISQVFWGIGILVFFLKTFDQSIFSLFGELLFLGMAFTLISPLSRLWRSIGKSSWDFLFNDFLFVFYRLWRNTTKPRRLFLVDIMNFLIFSISVLLPSIAVFFSFFQLEPDLLDGIYLLTLSSWALSFPALFSLLFSLATYSVLFDSSSEDTFAKILNSFILIFFLTFSTWFYYISIIRNSGIIYGDLLNVREYFVRRGISSLVIFVLSIVILWIIISAILMVKNHLKWLIWLIFSISFWSFILYQIPKQNTILTIITILFLLSSSIVLASNFATLNFRSKPAAKLLSWWYFLGLALPLSVICMPNMSTISEDLSWLDWSQFFVPVYIFWFLFLLSVSVPYTNNLVIRLKNTLKNRSICRILPLLLSTLLRMVLFGASFFITFCLLNLLESRNTNFFPLGYGGFLWMAIAMIIVILALCVVSFSFILWIGLLFVKSKISTQKSQVLSDQKIKSKYSEFRNLAVFGGCLGGADFVGANLTEADFSNAEVAGVNFRGARLNRTIWSNVQGLEGAAVGNTYLKYPKVRTWVVKVKSSIRVS